MGTGHCVSGSSDFLSCALWITIFVPGYVVVLRNVSMILDMADMYEAGQLKAACLDFICVNMETMLESRYVESLVCS